MSYPQLETHTYIYLIILFLSRLIFKYATKK